MDDAKVYRAIGLMSGTSMDGVIDVALIETDGYGYIKPLRFYEHAYGSSLRDAVIACFGHTTYDDTVRQAEQLITDVHIEAVSAFNEEADVIGFHGQTITHDPDSRFTWQIGDGQALATATGMTVIADMRQADIKAGGQGAPLLPLYHKAMLSQSVKPAVILNLGGVANMTYIDQNGALIAFDCGPANALMDDWMRLKRNVNYDKNGRLASQGMVQERIVKTFLSDPFFQKPPPKSLDRNHWSIQDLVYHPAEDGVATLLEMTVSGIEKGLAMLPRYPAVLYVAGGGRRNVFMLNTLQSRLRCPVSCIEDVGYNGDATEAEGFAYLATRALIGEHLTEPMTTGVDTALTGGQCFKP